MVIHAVSVSNKGTKDDEGFTPYRRWKGREFTKPVAEFGERVWYTPAMSAGRDKFDVRWREGVWLGIELERGESVISTKEGVVKPRDFRRKPENGGRWSVEDFDKFVGVAWEPYPGAKGGCELRSKVRLPIDRARSQERSRERQRERRSMFR